MVDMLHKTGASDVSENISRDQHYREKRRATLAGVAVNLPLAVFKIVVGFVGHSQALIADGVHSFSDLLSDALVLAALKVGAKKADVDHPYGHARVETAAMAGVALLLIVAALALGYDAIRRMGLPELLLRPGWLALAVAGLSLALKEGLYWYTIGIARQTRSPLLEANAWHHRSDALSSIAALAGIAGSMLGIPYFDALGALLIAAMLAWVGIKYAWRSVSELVDTGLDPERLRVVREHIADVPGVRRMRRLRTRTMGGHDAYADVGVFVDPYMSLTEAHRVSEAISKRLVTRVDEITDICVHIEPDGHADAPAAFKLPLREEIMPELEQAFAGLEGHDQIQRITLHYLDEAIQVEVLLPLAFAHNKVGAQNLVNAYANAIKPLADLDSIRVLFG